MKKIVITVFTFASLFVLTKAQDLVGDWQGTLKAGGADLNLALRITKVETGH